MTKQMTWMMILMGLASLVLLPGFADAGSTMIVTKGASADRSVFVAHSDDSEMFDNRLIYVPPADHKPGDMRPVYFDSCSIGPLPDYNSFLYRRYTGTHRGPGYVAPDAPQSVPIGYTPQVAHTYGYFDASYGVMNEHQLMFGECTNGSKTDGTKTSPARLFYSAELAQVALERCKTAKEAVKLIGHLIDIYGFYGTGETLPGGDPNEAWVIEMVPGPDNIKGLWVTKKVPDGEVFIAANELRIRDVDPDDPDMMYSKNLFPTAKAKGWWNPKAESPMQWRSLPRWKTSIIQTGWWISANLTGTSWSWKGMRSLSVIPRQWRFQFALQFNLNPNNGQGPPMEVSVVTVTLRDVPVFSEFVARTQSSQRVNIQARVSGFLEKRMYVEGSVVVDGVLMLQPGGTKSDCQWKFYEMGRC